MSALDDELCVPTDNFQTCARTKGVSVQRDPRDTHSKLAHRGRKNMNCDSKVYGNSKRMDGFYRACSSLLASLETIYISTPKSISETKGYGP